MNVHHPNNQDKSIPFDETTITSLKYDERAQIYYEYILAASNAKSIYQ